LGKEEGGSVLAATVTSKGQVTIPVEVRKALGLRSGSRVAFVPTGEGSYELVPETRTVRSLKGAITRPAEPVSLDRMEQAVVDGVLDRLRR
jgi:AbrB family looped-hinge helix DNA binding protein